MRSRILSPVAILGIGTFALLSGCAKPLPPNCMDETTLQAVKNEIVQDMRLKDRPSREAIDENLRLTSPRKVSLDDAAGKYRCAARLAAGATFEVDIFYESSLQAGEHVVHVVDLTPADRFVIKEAFEAGIAR